MTHPTFTLISHHLCPFVQRAAIALLESGIPFVRKNIDLSNKPDWFLKLSPLGKVPVLLVDDDTVLFESSVIAQYIDQVTGGGLLANEPLERAQQKAWMEFASSAIGNIGQIYSAADESALTVSVDTLAGKWQTLEAILGAGPWFGGSDFSLVDAAFAPAFRYFDVIEQVTSIDFFPEVEKVRQWRRSLAERSSVRLAVGSDYNERLLDFLARRDSVIGRLAAQRSNNGRIQAA